MYANGIAPEVGDVVGEPSYLGDVLAVTPNGIGGQMYVTVQWRAPALSPGQFPQHLAPVSVIARSLNFVRRK